MKTLIALLVFCLIPFTALAQEAETLISGHVTHGGFGGPVVKFSVINDDVGVFVGGRGGWIINFQPDHAFVLGGGGYGLTTDVKAEGVMRFDEQMYLALGYGGVELEYINRTKKLVHFSIHTLIGGGEVEFREKSRSFEITNGDVIFAMEPGISVLLNVAQFFRIGAGASYRFIGGVNLDGLSNSDISGFSAVLTAKFGKF